MIPVKVNLHTSRDRTETYSYDIVNDSFSDTSTSEHHCLQHNHFQ
jgi:hypothetical protein